MKQTAPNSGSVGQGAKVGPAADTLTILRAALGRQGARKVLDLGCGDSGIAKSLAENGLFVTGLDPFEDALEKARLLAPQVRFISGTADKLPPDLIQFGAAIFVNSLHHVPVDGITTALLNAIDAVQDGGVVLVIEPVAQGSFFCTMRPVEDESIVRAQAHRTVETLISSEQAILQELRRCNRENRFADLKAFVGYLARSSPERAVLAARNEAQSVRTWRDNICSHNGVAVLVQPMICWTLTGPGHQVKLGRL